FWNFRIPDPGKGIYEDRRAYLPQELELNSATDSARYFTHEAWRLYQADTNAQVKPLLKQALKIDSTLETAANSLSCTYYNQGVGLYRRNQFDASIDSLIQGIQTVSWSKVGGVKDVLPVLQHLFYAQGLVALRSNKVGLASSALRQAICQLEPLPEGLDENRYRTFRDSIAQVAPFVNLLQIQLVGDTTPQAILDCLFPQISVRVLAQEINLRSAPRSDLNNIVRTLNQGELYPVYRAYFTVEDRSELQARRNLKFYPSQGRTLPAYLGLSKATIFTEEDQAGVPEGYHHVSLELPAYGFINGYVSSFALQKPRSATWLQLAVDGQRGWVDSSLVELINEVDREPPYRP
ncbi:MAG: hypothetical protein AAF804_22185, partial [Bacteroidota bacterium]